MSGTHNFLPFDSSNANMTPDASYSNDANRINGVSNGVADPLSFNKAVHQASIMAAAIAQFVANQGISIDDTNLSNLTTALAESIASLTGISYADRAAHGLFGTADIGALNFCAAQGTPAAATYTASGTGNLIGGYHYREVLITGYNNPDGTHYVRGFSPAAQRSGYDVSPSSQQISIANLPLGSAGCIGRAIYRSAANGSAGSEKFCGIIWDNTTATYTDNLVDSQLGSGMPTVQGTSIPANVPGSNTTGTSVPIPTADQTGAIPVARTTISKMSDAIGDAHTAGTYHYFIVGSDTAGTPTNTNQWFIDTRMQGWGGVAVAYGAWDGSVYSCPKSTNDNGSTFYWGPWQKVDVARDVINTSSDMTLQTYQNGALIGVQGTCRITLPPPSSKAMFDFHVNAAFTLISPSGIIYDSIHMVNGASLSIPVTEHFHIFADNGNWLIDSGNDAHNALYASYAGPVPLTTQGLRNQVTSTADPSGGSDGDTWDVVGS